MNKMKVELVKVKIKKLKEVKKQLRKRKCSTKKNLKNLLLGNEETKPEDDIFYKSIDAIFQDDQNNNNETIHPLRNSDSFLPDYHTDFEDLLESLGGCHDDLSQEGPSENLSIKPPNIYNEERREESINLTDENLCIDSFNYFINQDDSNNEHQSDEIYPWDNIETESIAFDSSNKEVLESTININSPKFEPDMAELGNYYTPDTLFETTYDPMIELDDFCNQIDFAINGDSNKENIDEQVEHSEIGDPVMPNLNNCYVGGESNLHIDEEPSNEVRGVAMINPLLVSIPAADLQTMALYQLQQKSDSQEINDLGESEILNYTWEQKANVIAAAKILYTKKTRTLLHWLDPSLSLSKLRATLELSWQNLPLWQKEVYISQVMGPLVVETVYPMLNPHLKSDDFKISAPTSPKKSQHVRKKFSDFIKHS
nr:uncharacterized protein LOC106684921 isoform X2 [Halyomorpha halys]